MNKKINIVDYLGNRKIITIKNFEKVKEISVEVISGDEILIVLYKNGESKWFDSSDTRSINYHDGYYKIPLNKIDEFSNLEGSSYNRCEKIYEWI